MQHVLIVLPAGDEVPDDCPERHLLLATLARRRRDADELAERARADASTAPLVFFFFCCAIAWLEVASAAGLTASIKLHEPD